VLLELWQPERQAKRNDMRTAMLMTDLATIETKDWNPERNVMVITHLTDENYNEKQQHQYIDLNPAGSFPMDD
jgi:hypothetical protein